MSEPKTTRNNATDPVALAVWPWRQGMQAATGPAPRSTVATVVMQTLVAAAIAFVFYRKSHFALAGCVVAVAGALAVCSVVWHAGYGGVQRAFAVLGLWLGRILSYILLVPCFVLIFGVAHLLMLLSRRDPLGRRSVPDRRSYWEVHEPVADPAKRMEVPY